MKLTSKSVPGVEFEVALYDAGKGKKGIRHESLEDILYNRLPEELNVNYDIQVATASASYCAVKCTITDYNGRKTFGFNDVSLNHLEKDDAFTKQHPLTQAVQSAMDTAIKAYLQWPRLLDENDLPQEEKEKEEQQKQESKNAVKEESSANPDTEDAKTEESEIAGSEPEPEPEAEPEPEEDLSSYSLEEIGKMTIPIGKYSNRTIEAVWEENPSWFEFIATKSKSPKYNFAREYAKRKASE